MMTAMIASNRFIDPDQDLPDQDLHQEQQQRSEPLQQFNSFKGLYIGSSLINHLNSIDPNQEIWYFISDYINSFPYSKSFFESVFPFYMGSHVTGNELTAFYQGELCQ